jgi:hypothetical protein
MASGGLAAFGTLFKIGATTVTEVTSISGPGISVDTIDVTNHSSTGAWKEFVAGCLDGGEVTLDINYVPTDATHKNAASGILALLITRALTACSVVFSGSTWSFSCYFTKFQPSAPVGDKLSASVTVKISGAVTPSV